MAKELLNVMIRGHEYTPDEIMLLPRVAMYTAGSVRTGYRIDQERQVAFLVDDDGELVPDASNQPKFTVIRRNHEQESLGGTLTRDLLSSVEEYQNNQNTKAAKKSKTRGLSLAHFLLGMVFCMVLLVAAGVFLYAKYLV